MDDKDVGRKLQGLYALDGKLKGEITKYTVDNKDQFTLRIGNSKAMEALLEKGAVLRIALRLLPEEKKKGLVEDAYYWVRMCSKGFVIALHQKGMWYFPGNETGYGPIHIEEVGPRVQEYEK